MSATNIARLTDEWESEYRAFQKRSLADRDYVYVWVDGVHFNVRLEDDRLCTLVMIGVRPDGTKEQDADALLTFFDLPAEHLRYGFPPVMLFRRYCISRSQAAAHRTRPDIGPVLNV